MWYGFGIITKILGMFFRFCCVLAFTSATDNIKRFAAQFQIQCRLKKESTEDKNERTNERTALHKEEAESAQLPVNKSNDEE